MTEEKKCSDLLKAWFYKHRRDLPWRKNLSGYRVWVSEVMLQQTQVSVVIPYFEHWMRQFPTIKALAEASRDDVIRAWEGLGYYSRARNLHDAAQEICSHFNGVMPQTKQDLLKIKGIGPYTAGAIAAFAFGEKVIAVDGNVRRVLSRLYMVEDSIDVPKGQKIIDAYAEKLLCCDEPAAVVEGLIELGALVCQKAPKCWLCPLQKECKALKQEKTDRIPVRQKKPQVTRLHRLVWVMIQAGHVLIRREHQNGVMQDLWHFPFLEVTNDKRSISILLEHLKELLGKSLPPPELLDPIKHGFTRFQAHLYPHVWRLQGTDLQPIEGFKWVPLSELIDLPFCGGHRDLKKCLLSTKKA